MSAEKYCTTKGLKVGVGFPLLSLLGVKIETNFQKAVEKQSKQSNHRQELQMHSEMFQLDIPQGHFGVLLMKMVAFGYEVEQQRGVVHAVVEPPMPITFDKDRLESFSGTECIDDSFNTLLSLLQIAHRGLPPKDIEKQITDFKQITIPQIKVKAKKPKCPKCRTKCLKKTQSERGRRCDKCEQNIRYGASHKREHPLPIHSWQCPDKCRGVSGCWDLCCCCAHTCMDC